MDMNKRENELFEAELRRLKPAGLPEELQSRLNTPPLTPPLVTTRRLETRPHSPMRHPNWPLWLRWLAPAAAVGLAVLIAVPQAHRAKVKHTRALPAAACASTLKADQVEIDRQLLGSFDAVAEMPDGEPVRFRFQQWMDAVTLRDSVRGVEVVQRTPRIEVVPVSFVSY